MRVYRLTDEMMVGKQFGRLTVLERAGKKGRVSAWKCQCDCGKISIVAGFKLRQGRTRSCGCLAKELMSKRIKTHGLSKTRAYCSWSGMIKRTSFPEYDKWGLYYKRGITVCDRWKLFENFYSDMGECPKGMSIDRINNDGNYEPNNCRWATRKQQMRNTRSNVFIEYLGIKATIPEWAEKTGINEEALRARISRKWDINRAMNYWKG